jgi:hypothetical protein
MGSEWFHLKVFLPNGIGISHRSTAPNYEERRAQNMRQNGGNRRTDGYFVETGTSNERDLALFACARSSP